MENKLYFIEWPHRNYLSYEQITGLFANVPPRLAAVLMARRSIKKERRNKAAKCMRRVL